jgi:hypothetical protein
VSARAIGGALEGPGGERGPDEVQRGEGEKVSREAEVVGEEGGRKPAEKIARDIAGDVGGEGARDVAGASVLAEIGERQGEGRGHAEALRDAQGPEYGEVWREGEERSRDRKRAQAHDHAHPAVDALREDCDQEARDRHAQCRRIDGEPRLGRRRPIVRRERRQDRLCAEEVDEG